MPRRKTRSQQQVQELEEISNSIHAIDYSSPQMGTNDNINNNNVNLLDLTKALQGLQGGSSTKIKPPLFDGTGDVELFLLQFADVAKLNKWKSDEHLLHFRLSLTNKAIDCSRGQTISEITEMLRIRFGTSPRQAREKLRRLKKLPKQTIHDLGIETQRLTRLAYPNLREQDLEDIALEAFVQAIDSKAIKRHLLATPASTVAEAVQKADEYLQIGDNSPTIVSNIQNSSTETNSSQTTQNLHETIKGLQTLLETQTEMLKKLMERKPIKCFECGGPHRKRFCPQLKNPDVNTYKQGNEKGPVNMA